MIPPQGPERAVTPDQANALDSGCVEVDDAPMDQSIPDQLRALAVHRKSRSGRALLQATELGRIMELRCAMEECLYPQKLGGRSYFEVISRPLTDWIPTADHYPILQKDGGRLVADNVRLAHRLCNRVGATEPGGIPNAKDRAKAAALRESAFLGP
jgi:hypothetical protein